MITEDEVKPFQAEPKRPTPDKRCDAVMLQSLLPDCSLETSHEGVSRVTLISALCRAGDINPEVTPGLQRAWLGLFISDFSVFFHRGDSKADCFPSEWFKSVSMSMKISKAGFHRELQYSVQWSKIDHEVKALLVQQLPSGVYMDEYQLDTLRRDTGLEVLLDSKVDVEAPEYLSSGFTALVFLSGRREAAGSRSRPVHRPSASSKRVKVDLDPARLLLRSDQCEALQTNTSTCISPRGGQSRTARAGLHRVEVEARCTFSNHSICSWTELLDLQDSGGVSLELPVADSSMLLTVCAGTVLTAVLSCVYLLRNIWRHGRF